MLFNNIYTQLCSKGIYGNVSFTDNWQHFLMQIFFSDVMFLLAI